MVAYVPHGFMEYHPLMYTYSPVSYVGGKVSHMQGKKFWGGGGGTVLGLMIFPVTVNMC